MSTTDQLFIGIELASGRKPFTWAVLDRTLAVSTIGQGDQQDLLLFLSGAGSAAVAVNAPSGTAVRAGERSGKVMRAAEFELRSRGLSVPKTPSKSRECADWVQAGFELYRKLGQAGFQPHSSDLNAPLQVIETSALAGFAVLAGHAVLPKQSLEGRLQRQLLLFERGLRIADPMDFFEEVTRYKIMRGVWPMEFLYTPPQLDALCAAYTAWLALNKPAQTLMVGDVREGRMLLPDRELKDSY